MASSGRIIGGYLAGRGQRLEIEWAQTGDPATKTSTITCKVYVRHKTSTMNADSARSCTADCTGQTRQNWTSRSWSCSSEADLLQELSASDITWTVPCDAQGNHEPVTLSFRYNYKGESNVWVTASETIQLDRVPLASEISYVPASVTAGSTFTVSIRRYLDSYWHALTVEVESDTVAYAEFGAENSRSIISTLSWLASIPDAMQGVLTLTLETYEDRLMQVPVGDPYVVSSTLLCPDNADTRPEVTTGWAGIAPDNTGTRAAGRSAYIAGITKLTGAFDGTKIAAKYGASMAAKAIACEGLSDTKAYAGAAPVIGPLMTAGQKTVTLSVVDSRGLSATDQVSLTVYQWKAPMVTGMTAVRSDANGDPDELGAYIAVMATGSCSDVKDTGGTSFNSLALTVRYRQAGTQNWSSAVSLTPGSTEVIGGGSISTSYAYEVEVTAADQLSGSGTATEIVPKSSVTLNIREGGDGACFGGYATQDGLEIDWERIDAPNFSQGGVLIKAEDANGVWHTYRVLGVIESTP